MNEAQTNPQETVIEGSLRNLDTQTYKSMLKELVTDELPSDKEIEERVTELNDEAEKTGTPAIALLWSKIEKLKKMP